MRLGSEYASGEIILQFWVPPHKSFKPPPCLQTFSKLLDPIILLDPLTIKHRREQN